MKTDFLVVGAGPTGIGAASNLSQRGLDYLLVDAHTCPGGLARSVVDKNGFTWDMGGHVQFSHYDRFDEYMDAALGPDDWLHHTRQSWIWIAGRFVPYPFQNNLHRLPDQERERCLATLPDRDSNGHPKPSDFKSWIELNFGAGIADLFMVPYNLKTWAHPLELMGCQWVGDRVALPSAKAVRSAATEPNDAVDWGPNRTFRFPRFGGTGAVWSSLVTRLEPARVWLGDRVTELDIRSHRARLASARVVDYEHLISTMPLDVLAGMAGLGGATCAATRLRHSTTHVVGIGLAGTPPRHVRDKNWMYFPESDSPFYRVTVFSGYSPNNVPSPDTWSLMAEISESDYKPVDQRHIVESVLAGMNATGLLEADAPVISRWNTVLPYGYPVPTRDRDDVLAEVLPAFERLDVFSRGRFGAWKYEAGNQDHSFMQGWECVDRICSGDGRDAEPTLHATEMVNSGGWRTTVRK